MKNIIFKVLLFLGLTSQKENTNENELEVKQKKRGEIISIIKEENKEDK